jgi:hypothetical protein
MRSIAAVLLLVLTSSAVVGAHAADVEGVIDQLKSCARVVEREERFTCYEALGQRALAIEGRSMAAVPAVSAASSASEPANAVRPDSEGEAPATVNAPVASTSAATASVEAASGAAASQSADSAANIGGYQFEPESSAEEAIEKQAEEGLRTRIVLCQRDREGTWYFKLENGQVWKQVDRQTLSFQGCDFPAVVANDGLGYVLRIDGRKGKIRIKRRK